MAQVYPFRAFRYNPERVSFDRVLTQPYDKISPAMQEKYYAADPHNLIAVEKGRIYRRDTPQNNVYTRAGRGARKLDSRAPSSRRIAPRSSTPTRRSTPCPAPTSAARAAASSARANSKSIPPAWSSATSTRSPARKPTASSFFATPKRTPASFSCCTLTSSGASMRFSLNGSRRPARHRSARRIRRRASSVGHLGSRTASPRSSTPWPSKSWSSPTAITATKPR